MFLYEHQSTRNPNMPLRGVFYFSKLYQAYVSKNEYDIYSSAVVPLPVPKYVVFYNGTDKTKVRWIIRLSDAFIDKDRHTDWALDLERNREIMVDLLREYDLDTIRSLVEELHL